MWGCYVLELVEKDKQVIFLYLVYETGTIFSVSILILGFPDLILEKDFEMMFMRLLQLQCYTEEIQHFGRTIR